ncbi:flagellar protein FlbB [Pseudorhodoplanes sp.]|uniref:flagellar protein FlbB n=1 Tax=Pseudorhodoplanes sp. TaxID=1934341 RepID=UPI002C893B0D|nr:flagellar protein FlbB [Pseudorhodoplanes sp.]HWV51562.1 flagellar protein FlbB [Pseudorhodoplanes sp.]
MTLLFHRLRLVPIVLIAAAGLFLLKVSGIVLDGGYTLGAGYHAKHDRAAHEPANVVVRSTPASQVPEPARPKSWAQEMFGYPDVTGSVGASKPAPSKDAAAAEKPASDQPVDPKYARTPPKAPTPGTLVQLDQPQMSPSERALLERLSERRMELEKRHSELDMRETLLKAAEKRLDERLKELKQAEERIVSATQHKEEVEIQRLKNLVTMYEGMKAKDAAKIFEKLDVKLATDVARLIQPRRMADILSQMTPEAAQRLTVSLAAHAQADPKAKSLDLPKIEGRPSGS